MKKVDILLVDDREDSLIALTAALNNPRYNLISAHSGEEALALLPKHDFAVILLDVQMPEMDGFETASRIKRQEHYKHTPIIFVTAIHEDSNYIYKGYVHGAVDYIFKPFDAQILRSKVGVFADLYLKSKQLEEQAERLRETERSQLYLWLAQLEVESLKRYQNLADSIPHVVWRAKADGTMDYFNRVWSDYTGISDQQSLGTGWQSAFHPDDLQIFYKVWMRAMEKRESFQTECRIRNRGGEMRWHLLRVVVESRGEHEIIAWLGTCTDIHDRKVMEEELIKARHEADAANHAKTNFLANMSHEIRTPLNSILGFTELIMYSNPSEEDRLRSLTTIKRNGHQLLEIIDEILDISKVEVGHLEIEKEEMDSRKFFSDLRTLLEVQAEEKSLAFHFRCTTQIPTKIVTDSKRLRQILVNIVGNAIKFTDSGQVDMAVSWNPSASNPLQGLLRCTVTDTGIGIEISSAKDLFQPFVQVDGSITRRFGGTGLGLALSRRLARALGGNVFLENSEKGQGSTFIVEINVTCPPQTTLTDQLAVPEKNLEKKWEEKSTRDLLRDVKILVVDDSPDNCLLIGQFLRAAGAQVDCAQDGIDGVQKALAKDYQLILMDIQMPKLDGYGATAKLRSQGYNTPIIALTAHALKQEREHSLRSGCNDHLTKPIDRITLLNQVKKYVGGYLH